jgi:uncharacterized hydrophobic protein (TIGR00341 family)
VLLAIVVAAVGLERGSATIIIGAMVMAPLLGPNMALALATTLGDATLFVRAARTSLVGGGLTFLCSYLLGLGVTLEGPLSAELMSRTSVAWGDLALALASGMAGALAVVAGSGMSLVGVMVAVALLPPLVTVGLLSANGRTEEAVGALLLVAANIVCVNVASMATFLVRGVRPQHWWQSAQSTRYSHAAMVVWITLLTVITALLLKQHLAAQAR